MATHPARPLIAHERARLLTELQVIKRGVAAGVGGIASRHRLRVLSGELRKHVTELGADEQVGEHSLAIEAAVTSCMYDQALAACTAFELVLEGKPAPAPVAPAAALVPEKAIAPLAPTMLDDPVRTHDVPDQEQGPAEPTRPEDASPPRAKRAGPGAPVADGGISSVAQLGEAVRQARRHKGLSQQEIATAAGVGRRFVVELEGGKATVEIGRVLAVCRAAGVTLAITAA